MRARVEASTRPGVVAPAPTAGSPAVARPVRHCAHPSAERQPLFTVADAVTGDSFTVVNCRVCGLARTVPPFEGAQLDRYYPRGYHRTGRRYRFGLDRSLAVLHGARIRRIQKLTGRAGSVLDIGCGPGWLLDRMRRQGWETRGLERSSDAARHGREVLRLDVRVQDLKDVVTEGATYDAVVLWHVAEHLPQPGEALRQIAALLKPGGVLMVAVPNFASPEARLGRGRWFHLDVPRHLYHFTPATLSALLAEAGLRSRRVVHLSPEYDVFSFVQTGLNLLGIPPNLLYDLIRRDEARLRQGRADLLSALLAVTLAAPLTILGVIWAPLAAALGRSATVTIYAQRAE